MHPDRTTPCPRNGCQRPVRADSPYRTCSGICTALHRFEIETLRISDEIGECPAAEQLHNATAELLDSFDHLLSVRREVRKAAGITAEAWTRLLRGQQQQA